MTMPTEVSALVCGPEAEAQVLDPDARLRLACTLLESKAGPEGEKAKKGQRAWRLLAEHAVEHQLPRNGLPASQTQWRTSKHAKPA
ncbi:MAG: hypothetical protein SGPRY_003589 [Prymnesium sp.]